MFTIVPLTEKIEILLKKKDIIIKKYDLKRWNWIDNTELYDDTKCWYCNYHITNQCSCNGIWKYYPYYEEDDEDFQYNLLNDLNELNY